MTEPIAHAQLPAPEVHSCEQHRHTAAPSRPRRAPHCTRRRREPRQNHRTRARQRPRVRPRTARLASHPSGYSWAARCHGRPSRRPRGRASRARVQCGRAALAPRTLLRSFARVGAPPTARRAFPAPLLAPGSGRAHVARCAPTCARARLGGDATLFSRSSTHAFSGRRSSCPTRRARPTLVLQLVRVVCSARQCVPLADESGRSPCAGYVGWTFGPHASVM